MSKLVKHFYPEGFNELKRNLSESFFIDYSKNIINQVKEDWNLYEILRKAFIEFEKTFRRNSLSSLIPDDCYSNTRECDCLCWARCFRRRRVSSSPLPLKLLADAKIRSWRTSGTEIDDEI